MTENVDMQDEAGSLNLRVGLTPHIKALRTSLADDDDASPAAASAPSSAPALALHRHSLPPSGQQRGDRRASLAEAPRPNLLFEPAAEAEVIGISRILYTSGNSIRFNGVAIAGGGAPPQLAVRARSRGRGVTH